MASHRNRLRMTFSRLGRLDFIEKKDKYFLNSIETFPNSIKVLQNDNWALKDLKDNHRRLLDLIRTHYEIEDVEFSLKEEVNN